MKKEDVNNKLAMSFLILFLEYRMMRNDNMFLIFDDLRYSAIFLNWDAKWIVAGNDKIEV